MTDDSSLSLREHNPETMIENQESTPAVEIASKASVKGYLRLGELYETQGKQQCAIATYDEGLRCTPSTDPSYAQLMDAKVKAAERNDKRVDFIANLPVELVQSIMVDLSKGDKAACLYVSRIWRSKVFNSQLIWAVMTVDDSIFDNCFATILPYIAAHVEHLTLNPSTDQIWSEYMHHLQDGSFTKIRSLQFNGDGVLSVQPAIYPQIKSTLTKLDLFEIHMPAGFTIADILHTCRNLKHLGYRGHKYLRDIAGDFDAFAHYQHPLRDLQLNSYATAEDIEPLLQYCQQLQRLVLNESTDSVLDVVYKTCHNLRIFAFNPNLKITALEDLEVPEGQPGLLEFHTISGNYGAPPQGVLPFIRDSMDTIKVIVANISLTIAQDAGTAPYFNPSDRSYADLQFTKLERLSYWSDPTTLFEPILLRSISACTTLRALTVVQVKIMDKFIDMLMTLAPLEELDMSFTWEEESISQGLVRLFRYYARHSRTHNICLSHCRSATDEVLDALGDIRSLRTLALWELSSVSEAGLDRALKKLSGAVTFLNLSKAFIVKDRHLATVGAMQGLKKLKLQQLNYITKTGVVAAIEASQTLEHLIIAQCSGLSQSTYPILEKHVKNFELKYVIDYD